MSNKICHFELTTQDMAAAKEFYGSLFDWKLESMSMDDEAYIMINTGEEPSGGMMAAPSAEVPSAWVNYVQVEDVEASAARAAELGGQIIVAKTPIPEMGYFAVISDPTGAVIGVWEPAKE